MIDQNAYLQIGEIYREHGVKGYCKTHIFSQSDENLVIGLEFILAADSGETLKVVLEDVSHVGRYYLLKFSEINSPETCQKWRKAGLWLNKNHLQRRSGEMYDYEWEGYVIMDARNRKIGVIQKVDYTPLKQFVVRDDELDEEIIIPYNSDWIVKTDPMQKTVIMNLPEGLIDL